MPFAAAFQLEKREADFLLQVADAAQPQRIRFISPAAGTAVSDIRRIRLDCAKPWRWPDSFSHRRSSVLVAARIPCPCTRVCAAPGSACPPGATRAAGRA